MKRGFVYLIALFVLLTGLVSPPVYGIDDLYQWGGQDVENYHRWEVGKSLPESLFSPLYHPNDPDTYWDRVDKETPSMFRVFDQAWNTPRKILWDTPLVFGENLKLNYYDTFKQSTSTGEIARNMLLGLPNSAMLLMNGWYDGVTDFGTDVMIPAVAKSVGAPLRLAGQLAEPLPSVHSAIDAIPKAFYGVWLPVRKVGTTVTDELQKTVNFAYRSVTNPLQITDHLKRYWPQPIWTEYQPNTYVPQSASALPAFSGTSKEVSEPAQTGEMVPSRPVGPVPTPSAASTQSDNDRYTRIVPKP